MKTQHLTTLFIIAFLLLANHSRGQNIQQTFKDAADAFSKQLEDNAAQRERDRQEEYERQDRLEQRRQGREQQRLEFEREMRELERQEKAERLAPFEGMRNLVGTFSVSSSENPSSGLSPDIEADRLLTTALAEVQNEKWSQALNTMYQIAKLDVKCRTEFNYYYARIAERAGQWTVAKPAMQQFLKNVPRDNPLYAEGLKLWDVIESKVTQQEARSAKFDAWKNQKEVPLSVHVTGVDKKVGFTLSTIHPGSFVSSPAGNNSRQITLTHVFWMAQTETTEELYQLHLGKETASKKPANVKWNDAVEFCNWLTKDWDLPDGYEFRLPTEAEWEYACRAETKGDFAGDLDEMAWYFKTNDGHYEKQKYRDGFLKLRSHEYESYQGYWGAHEVGLKKPNAWGLYDMHGNIGEWCWDWYSSDLQDATNPFGPKTGNQRVIKGARWNTCHESSAAECASSFRTSGYPDNSGAGFRFVLAPKPD
jgi:formylglycine-generating enzyme required for sulfatase activity